ncbi:MAG: thioesterase family protein [Verrucomicrobiales bacterium]|nr:thioesterase family protein [Verrucomicrobiales bacterium]
MSISPVYSQEEVVFYDTDCGGVVSNIAYLRYVEKARCHLFASLGMGLASMNETQLFPTVIRTEIDYRKPARLGDKLVVEARIASFDKVRIQCDFIIYAEEDPSAKGNRVIFSEARQTVVLVQMPEGKPARVPDGWKVD